MIKKEEVMKNWDFSEKLIQLGTSANALISLHLKEPEKYSKEWLFNQLIQKYDDLQLDIDNREEE